MFAQSSRLGVTGLAIACAMLSILRAQQSQAPASRALVPAAASSVAANPDVYVGQIVSIMAAVEQRISATAFSIDQDRRATAANVLVLAPRLTGTIELNTYVTVIGEVVRFDPDEIARRSSDIAIDLPPEVAAAYRGRPAVLATSVINGAMVDLAKRLPPAMTTDEQAFSAIMQRVGPAFNALRQAISGFTADAAQQQTAVLKPAFAEAEAFWKTRRKPDAIGWADEARRQVDAIERGVSAGKWEEVKTASTALGQACQNCHGAYRERFDDGSYRIKMK
jgi:hypothetical protein